MTVLLVVLLFVAFVGIDFLMREATKRIRAARERARREAILDEGVRLEFSFQATSLKRVEIPEPRARILAVDDEPIVLDAFRRALVLEGYNVDTVERAPEALYLLQRNDYDFVFTDLRMPGMDGVELVKAVKHLRPDIDVVVFTGYATLDSAVETMKHGCSDYVQKPFTGEELVLRVNRLAAKRAARLEALRKPSIRLVSAHEAEGAGGAGEYIVPGGSFISSGHAWVRIEAGGEVRVGIDDFAQQAAGVVNRVAMPRPGQAYRMGEPLFSLERGTQELHFLAPVSGKVVEDNAGLVEDAGCIKSSPYVDGWVCRIEPTDLATELAGMRIGHPVVGWYDEEIKRLDQLRAGKEGVSWAELENEFLAGANR